MAHLVDLQSFSQMAAPGPALPDLLWNVRLHGHCLYRWVNASHGTAEGTSPPAHRQRGVGDGVESRLVQLCSRIEPPLLSPYLFFFFLTPFLQMAVKAGVGGGGWVESKTSAPPSSLGLAGSLSCRPSAGMQGWGGHSW